MTRDISTMPPLKILHFHFGKEGGAERFFVNLAQSFAKRNIEQRFVIRPNRSWGDSVKAIGPVIENNFNRVSPKTLWLHLQVELLVRQWKPDAVMAWMPRAGRLMHRWPGIVKLARMGDFPRKLKHFSNCDILVGNLPDISERCKDLGWKKYVHTISNFPKPVQPKPVSRADFGTPEDAFLITSGGRFVDIKGFDVLLRAVSRIPDAWLWLFGDGEEKAGLLKLANELGINHRVRFIGWIDEPIHFVSASDLFVMPSRHEVLGNALLEAWNAGVPTISTRTKGPLWYMRDNIDGIMIDIDDVDGLTESIQKFMAHPEIGLPFIANSRDRLREFFTEDAVVDAYMKVFRGDFSDGRLLG